MAQGCASGWESQVANGTNCFMFMPDDHMGWNDAQVIACKYYLKEIQLFVNKFLMDKCSFMGH